MGENWLPSAFEFALTGIGLPVLGVLTMNKVGSFKAFSDGVSKLVFTSYVVFTNTSRTATTAYELGIVPNLGARGCNKKSEKAEPILAIFYPITIVLIFVGIAGILKSRIFKL